jgi:hypothetical protein
LLMKRNERESCWNEETFAGVVGRDECIPTENDVYCVDRFCRGHQRAQDIKMDALHAFVAMKTQNEDNDDEGGNSSDEEEVMKAKLEIMKASRQSPPGSPGDALVPSSPGAGNPGSPINITFSPGIISPLGSPGRSHDDGGATKDENGGITKLDLRRATKNFSPSASLSEGGGTTERDESAIKSVRFKDFDDGDTGTTSSPINNNGRPRLLAPHVPAQEQEGFFQTAIMTPINHVLEDIQEVGINRYANRMRVG